MTSSEKSNLYDKFWEKEFIWQVLRKDLYDKFWEKDLYDKFWEKQFIW